MDLLKGERQKIRASPQPNEAFVEISHSGISEGQRETHQGSWDKMPFRRLRKEICSLRKPQPSVFCLPLATTLYRHAQILSCSFPSPFTLLFLFGPIFFCESRSCCVGRGLFSTSGKKRKRVSFLTSLRKSCNCSFPSLPLTSGAYTCNPPSMCVTPHHSSQGHQLPPIFWEMHKCLFQVTSLLKWSLQRQERGWETQLEGEVFNREFGGEGVRSG